MNERADFDIDQGVDVGARRLRLRIRGLVQGVGFRPHVWRLAKRDNLTGFALNDQNGVLMEVQGNVEAFIDDLVAQAPPLARIDDIESELRPFVADESDFVIRDSKQNGPARTAITPDVATCDACLAEMFDPSNRRYLYPFITCTHCGPRFTITRRLPYDRATTALAEFPLCDACAAEYADPADRRFHAETTCCPRCGPQLDTPLEAIGARIRAGEIVALKGLGGFHLVCDARDEASVERLRARKQRDGKPFAVMVANVATAGRFATIDGLVEATACGSRTANRDRPSARGGASRTRRLQRIADRWAFSALYAAALAGDLGAARPPERTRLDV